MYIDVRLQTLFSVLFVCAVVAHALPAAAQALPFGECRAGYWSSNRNLDDNDVGGAGTCFVNWRPVLADGVRLGVNVRAGLRKAATATDSTAGGARLREGFLEIETSQFTWRVGRQIIAWGRADRINPTDNLSPRDFTTLTPEDDEQRNGINAGLVRYQLRGGNLPAITAVVLQFEENRMPQGALPPNIVRAQRPKPHQAEFALKVDRSGSGLDWSISYFDGFERLPRYGLDLASPTLPVFRSVYRRARVLGGDFAFARDAWTMRGEFSVSRYNQACDKFISCEQSGRKANRAVLGVDRDFWSTTNINVQLFAVAHDYRAPAPGGTAQQPVGIPVPLALALNRLNSEFASHEWGMTFRVSDRLFNDRLKLELAAVVDFTNQSSILRPRASFALSDSVKISAGADLFHGDRQTYFGVLKKNNTVYVELGLVF